MKRWGPLGIGLGAYVLALIATAPATLVDAGLKRASEGRLRLAEAQGTLWSGTGQLEIRDTRGRTGVAKSLAWRVVPLSLLRAHLVCEVGLEQTAKRFPVTLSLSRIELANADISVPAAALGLAVPKLAALELTGEMQLRVSSLSIGRSATRGSAMLQWHAAGSALSPVSPLGDYELRIEGDGPAVRATLHTLKGPLRLDGKGSWTYGDSPAFAAIARVPPQHRQQLAPLLRLIAVERGDGSFELTLK
jgi:general secretion pathway protein N